MVPFSSVQFNFHVCLEPWLAVVIDPIRTIAAGQVDLGAFRTYPKGHIPADEKSSEHRNIPLKKVEDFGSHYKEYYQLNVSYFKTSSDKRLLNQLWNQYWVATLSSSAWFKNLGYNIEQTQDVAAKMEVALGEMRRENFGLGAVRSAGGGGCGAEIHDFDKNFRKAIRDGRKVASEAMQAVMMQIVKQSIFNDFQTTGGPAEGGSTEGSSGGATEGPSTAAGGQNVEILPSAEIPIDEFLVEEEENADISDNAAGVGAPLAVQEMMNVD